MKALALHRTMSHTHVKVNTDESSHSFSMFENVKLRVSGTPCHRALPCAARPCWVRCLKGVQVVQQLNPAYMAWQSASRSAISPNMWPVDVSTMASAPQVKKTDYSSLSHCMGTVWLPSLRLFTKLHVDWSPAVHGKENIKWWYCSKLFCCSDRRIQM